MRCAIVVYLLGISLQAIAAAAGQIENAPTLPSAWPQFRHGFDSNGVSSLIGPSGLLHGKLGENFTIADFKLEAKHPILTSGSVDSDGTVYFLTEDSDLIGIQQDKVVVNFQLSKQQLATCKLNVPAGRARYEKELTASPIVVGLGVVMVPSSKSLHMTMVDCRIKSSPKITWEFSETSICNSATLGFNDTVIFVSQLGSHVYAFNISQLPFEQTQKPIWDFDLDRSHNAQASVSVDSSNGSVYAVVADSPRGMLHKIYRDGKRASATWNMFGVPLTSPAIWVCEPGQTYHGHASFVYECNGKDKSGFIYVGTSTGIEAFDRSNIRPNAEPVWALNLTSAEDIVQSSPAVHVVDAGGQKHVYIYFGTMGDSRVHGIDGLRGYVWWQTDSLGSKGVVSSPAVDVNGTVYAASVSPPALYAFDPTSGDTLWEHELDGEVVSSPSIVDEEVIAIATTSNSIYHVFVNGSAAPTTPTTPPTTTVFTTNMSTISTTNSTPVVTTNATPVTNSTPVVTTNISTISTTSIPTTHLDTTGTSIATTNPAQGMFGTLTEWEFVAMCIGGFIVLVTMTIIVYINCIREKSELEDFEQTPLVGDTQVRARVQTSYETVNL